MDGALRKHPEDLKLSHLYRLCQAPAAADKEEEEGNQPQEDNNAAIDPKLLGKNALKDGESEVLAQKFIFSGEKKNSDVSMLNPCLPCPTWFVVFFFFFFVWLQGLECLVCRPCTSVKGLHLG